MDIFQTTNGIFIIYPDDYIISGWIRSGYIYEYNLVNDYLKKYILKSKIIIDAGANIGCHAISYSNFNPNATIYAFEPQKEIYDVLNKNKRLNHSSNLVCLNHSLGHANCDVNMNPPLKTPDGINYAGTGIGIGGEPTKMVTIDSLHLSGLDFLKMDVQGSEGLVIMGARETITKYKPTILFEHDNTRVDSAYFELAEIPTPFFELVKLGYNTFKYLGGHNYITQWNNELNFEDSFNFLTK